MNKLHEEANKLGVPDQVNDAANRPAITQSKQEIEEKFKKLDLQKTLSDYIACYVKNCETNSELDTVYADFILFAGNDDIIHQYGAALINHAFKSHAFNNIFSKKEFIGNDTIQKVLVERLLNEKQWQHELEPWVRAVTDLGNLYKVLYHFADVSWQEPGKFLLFLDNVIEQQPEFEKFRYGYNFGLFKVMSLNPEFAKDNKKLLEASDQKTLGDIYGPCLDDLKKYIKSLFKESRPINHSVFKLIENYQGFGLTDEDIIQPMKNEVSQHQQAKRWIDIFNNDFTHAKSELEDLKSQYNGQTEANGSVAKGILEKIILNLQLFASKVAAPVSPEEQARNQQRLARVECILPVLEDVEGVKKLEAEILTLQEQLNYQFAGEEHLELYDSFQRKLQTFYEELLDTIYMIYPEYKKVKLHLKEAMEELKSLPDQLEVLKNNDHSLLNVITASFDLHELLNNMGKKDQQETINDSGWQIVVKNAKLVGLAKKLPRKAQKLRELLMHEDGLGYFANVRVKPFDDVEYCGRTIADYEQLKETSEEEIKSGQGNLKNKYAHAIARFNLGECRSALADLKDLESKRYITRDDLIYHQAAAKVHYLLESDALEQLETVKSYVPALLLTAKIYRTFANRISQRLKNEKTSNQSVNNNLKQREQNYLSKANAACENAMEIYKDFLKYLEKNGSTLRDDDELQRHLHRMGLGNNSSLGLIINKFYSTRKDLIEITKMEEKDILNHLKHENDLKLLFDQIKQALAKIYLHRGQEKFNACLCLAAIANFKEGFEILPNDDNSTIQLRIDLHSARAKVYITMSSIKNYEMEPGQSFLKIINVHELPIGDDTKVELLKQIIEFHKLAIGDYIKVIELLKQLPKHDQKYTDCCNDCAKSYRAQGNAYEKLGQIYRSRNLSDSAIKCFENSKDCYNLAKEFLSKKGHEQNEIIKFMNNWLLSFKNPTVKQLQTESTTNNIKLNNSGNTNRE
jgi:hypothetical protein